MSKAASPGSAREIQRESADVINSALEILGNPKQDSHRLPLPGEKIRWISESLAEVIRLHQRTDHNDYTQTILTIAEWTVAAASPDYLSRANDKSLPSVLSVLRKALEVLHCLLHRDLRRRQLSRTESQLVKEFVQLASHYPDPVVTNQDDQGITRKTS